MFGTCVKNKTCLWGVAVVLLLIATGAIYDSQITRSKTITHTKDGFKPERVVIRKGDRITFVTNTRETFWPASNAHPTHSFYPAFDPKRELAPEEEWEIILDRPGTWDYHDHINPSFKGTIIIKGKSNENLGECLANSEGTSRAACWRDIFVQLLKDKGMDAAFDEITIQYNKDDDFKNVCHDIMHYFGDLAYYQFAENDVTIDREETRYCGYGFYHGFIEAALSEFGSSYLSEGKRYCDAFLESTGFSSKSSGKNARNACYHGLGHAIFDSLDSSMWGDDSKMVEVAIGICEGLFEDALGRAQCGSGVFNALSIAYVYQYYDLSFSEDGSYAAVCNVQNYPYQRLCYMEVSHHYLGSKMLSFEEEIQFVETLSQSNVKEAEALVLGLMDTRVRVGMSELNLEKMYTICTNFSDERIVLSCVGGVIIGLMNGGPPGKGRELVNAFCDLFPTEENYCSLGVPNSLGVYSSGLTI